MDYGFTHAGKVYTPNGTTGITANDQRNDQLEAAELARWADQPDQQVAYYSIPTLAGNWGTAIRTVGAFHPHDLRNATVSTWLGTTLGHITSAHVYRHNFGGRMVSLYVKGTNGAEYYGRASWDGGNVIKLRRVQRTARR